MSIFITTGLERFRKVADGTESRWLLECPGCGEWLRLSDDQWNGRVSVDHATDGCSGKYHETHNYGASLVAKMQARIMMGEAPYDPPIADALRKEDGE